MQPALSALTTYIRTTELRERAERERRHSRPGRRGARKARAHEAAVPPASAPLSLQHGYFGREHGSHA